MVASEYLITSFNGMGNTTYTTVAYENEPPIINSSPVLKATAGEQYIYNIVATDPDPADEDSLILSATTLPEWLRLDYYGDGTGMLSGTPTSEHIGNHSVELVVSDSNELSYSQSFTIVVEPKDDFKIYLPLIIY